MFQDRHREGVPNQSSFYFQRANFENNGIEVKFFNQKNSIVNSIAYHGSNVKCVLFKRVELAKKGPTVEEKK